jgi:hypothetical protein
VEPGFDAAQQLVVGVAEGLYALVLQLVGDRLQFHAFGGGGREDRFGDVDVRAEGALDVAVIGEDAAYIRCLMGGGPMAVLSALNPAGPRRSPATMLGYHAGRPPRSKGRRY